MLRGYNLHSTQAKKIMTEEKSESTYGAVDATQSVKEGEPQERVPSVSSFYDDETCEIKDYRTKSDMAVEKTQLQEGEQEEKNRNESCLSSENAENQHNTNDVTTTEKLPRPTRVSFSNGQPASLINDAKSPISARHVSFLDEANQNGTADVGVSYDNRGYSPDILSSTDSASRVRAFMNCSVHYHTHSEAEECNESEISLVLNLQQSSQTTPRHRRRRYTRSGAIVSDSFVNECICCCTII